MRASYLLVLTTGFFQRYGLITGQGWQSAISLQSGTGKYLTRENPTFFPLSTASRKYG